MARIDIPEGGGRQRERLFALQPHVGLAMGAMAEAVYTKMSLPAEEREVARVRIAALNGCGICLNTRSEAAVGNGFDETEFEAVAACSVGDVHDLATLTERQQLAGEYADRFAVDHHRIDDDFMTEMRRHFSDTEIVELTALCAMTVGNGRFMTVLGVEVDDDGHYWLDDESTNEENPTP